MVIDSFYIVLNIPSVNENENVATEDANTRNDSKKIRMKLTVSYLAKKKTHSKTIYKKY